MFLAALARLRIYFSFNSRVQPVDFSGSKNYCKRNAERHFDCFESKAGTALCDIYVDQVQVVGIVVV